MNWRLMLIAFAVGSAIKVLEASLRREQLDVALTEGLNRDESQRIAEILAEHPVYDQWVLMVLLFVSPRRAALRCRRFLMEDQAQRDESNGL